MPQKKKGKKTNKKTHIKKHLTQKQNIIFQSIPNYSSGQFTGHQNNKNNIQYGPAIQQESRTDNLVGDLVSKLIGKIETDGNKQTQEYSKEIQPINNTSSSSITGPLVQIYNDGTKTGKKTDETPSQTPDNQGDNTSGVISDGIRNAARSATEDFFLNAGSGLAAIAGAALGTSGWRNRKAIRNSISSFPTNAKNRLSSIRERFRNPSSYQPQVDVPSPVASVTGSQRASNAASPAASIAGSRRPSNASSAENNIIDGYFTAMGISPERSARVTTTSSAQRTPAARPRSNSTSSSSVYYREGGGANLLEQFDNASAKRSSGMRTPKSVARGLNTEHRTLLEQTLKKQGLDPDNLSPINQDILRGRQSGIQQRDVGASTRTVRAQTGEPHGQLVTQPRGRGRGRIRPYGPARPVGRPQTNEYPRPIGPARPVGRPSRVQAQAQEQAQAALSPQAQTRARPAVTRKVGAKTQNNKSN
jgi:hypothetical protein